MKNKITLVLSAIFLLAIMSSVNAEVSLWTDINIDHDDQTVSQYGYYQFDDTSARGVGRNKPIEVLLWYEVEPLPYDLTANYSGYVDWCNLTISHDKNEYGGSVLSALGFTGGEYINTTTETQNYYFENTSSPSFDSILFELKDKDSLRFDMKCHYTDSASLFVESILFGRVNTYIGAYECDDCEEYSLEELSNEIERNEELAESQVEIWEKIHVFVELNYNVWLIISWVLKISLIFTAVSLIFGGIYWLYLLFKSIEREI